MDSKKESIRSVTKSSNVSELLKCPEGFSIRRVAKISNVFELLKSVNGYSIEFNGREIARSNHEDIVNFIFTKLIAIF